MKIIAIPVKPTTSPNLARRNRVSKRPKLSPSPPQPGGRTPLPPVAVLGSSIETVRVYLAILPLVGPHSCGIGLHHIIAGRARHAVFVRAVVNRRCMSAKIVVRRRRRRRPLERGRLPRIVTRLLPVFHAPEQIEEKDELRPNGDERHISDELLKRQQRMKKRQLRSLRVPPRMSRHPQIMHR